jgi:DUF4097 and DUF4098 domain-containing protein YvlB
MKRIISWFVISLILLVVGGVTCYTAYERVHDFKELTYNLNPVSKNYTSEVISSDKLNAKIEISTDKLKIDVDSSLDNIVIDYFESKTIEYVISYDETDGLIVKEKSSFNRYFEDLWIVNSFFSENLMHITFPTNTFESLSISAAVSAIELDNINAETLTLKQSSGTTILQNSIIENATIKEASGIIIMNNNVIGSADIGLSSGVLTAIENNIGILKCNIASGSIKVTNLISDNTQINVSGGNIKLDYVTSTIIVVNKVAGSFAFTNLDSQDIDFKNTAGNIDGSLIGKESDYKIDIYYSGGNCNLAQTNVGERLLKIRSSSGSIHITFA